MFRPAAVSETSMAGRWPQRRFISNAEILQNIDRDLGAADADRRKDTRYFM